MLFASCKPLIRAENIKTLYDAWNGNKKFVQMNPLRRNPEILSGRHSVIVADECPAESPGKVVMVGHGYPGCKLGGLDQPYPYITSKDTNLITYIIEGSEYIIPLTAKMFGINEDQVLPFGKPRTDIYFIDQKPNYIPNKRVYLYAPTYRNKEETPIPKIEWDIIDGNLSDDELFIVKPHMMDGKQLHKEYRHIIEVSSNEPSNPYLLETDVLITDYSSIMVDALILNIPVVLFEKQPGYLLTRGMYFNYPFEYSSRYCTDERSLLAIIRKANTLSDVEITFRDRVAKNCDGHSTERIIELLEKIE